MKKTILAVALITVFASCGPSTSIVKTWMEPGTSVEKTAENKTLVIAMVKDETSRRVVEDQLAKRGGGQFEASYNMLSADEIKAANESALTKKLDAGKFKYVLLMRLADVEKETSYVPGTTTGFYGGYGRFYGYGASMYSTPGYYQTDKNYFIETTVYSVSPNKLLWTGTTKTVNPSKIESAVNDIADVVSDKMKKDGFLK
jgi:hypothetical protein